MYLAWRHGTCIMISHSNRYKVILRRVTDTIKKYIQVAKPKSRRYLIQKDILQHLFGKVHSVCTCHGRTVS